MSTEFHPCLCLELKYDVLCSIRYRFASDWFLMFQYIVLWHFIRLAQ